MPIGFKIKPRSSATFFFEVKESSKSYSAIKCKLLLVPISNGMYIFMKKDVEETEDILIINLLKLLELSKSQLLSPSIKINENLKKTNK